MQDELIVDAWQINNRAMIFLIEHFPQELWAVALPGSPRKTVRSIAAHVHNGRCLWFKSLAKFPGFRMPPHADPRTVTRAALVRALEASDREMVRLFRAGIENGGDFPGVTGRFMWGAMPRNALLFLSYAVSHESHHRGQMILMARALGHPLPRDLVGGVWQFSSRLREIREAEGSPRRKTAR